MNNNLRLLRRVKPVVVSPREDVRLNDLQDKLGIQADLIDFADADPDEILQRQSIAKWLLNNHSVLESNFFVARDTMNISFGDTVEQFLAHTQKLARKNTDFWFRLGNFVSAADSLYCPPERVLNLLHHIEREGEVKYNQEVTLCEDVIKELRKTISASGILEFSVKPGELFGVVPARAWLEAPESGRFGKLYGDYVKDLVCVGVWPYHEKLDPTDDPGTTGLELALKKNFKKTSSKLAAWRRSRMESEVKIRQTPRTIALDIATYLSNLFSNRAQFSIQYPFTVQVGYEFDQRGLIVRILDWQIHQPEDMAAFNQRPQVDFGMQLDQKDTKHLYEQLFRFAKSRQLKFQKTMFNQWFMDNSEPVAIDTYHTYKVYCSPKFKEVKEKFEDQMKAITDWQLEIIAAFGDIDVMRKFVKGILKTGEKFVFPEISFEDQILELRGLYPIRLKSKYSNTIKRFGKVMLNGKALNITGRNSSGKTTLMLAVLDFFLKAQNGLPGFAKYATISPRTHFLLSFLDRDSNQSTFMAKMVKDKNILDILADLTLEELRKVLILVDELGSATEQIGVMNVARQMIDCVYIVQASLIMATQIPEISEYVEKSGQGVNYQFTDNYQLKPGIGRAEPEIVARRMGYFETVDKIKAKTNTLNKAAAA